MGHHLHRQHRPPGAAVRRAAPGLDTFTRLLGTSGQIHITNPFHPGASDHYEVHAAGSQAGAIPAGADEPSFTAAIRHINAVLAGEAEPRLLAVDTSLPLARALHDLAESATR